MASFEAKMGEERPRKREKKNYRSDQFLSDQEQQIKKKKQKIKKHWNGSFQAKTGQERPRKKIKIIVLINSNPTCNSEFQKKRKKIQKTKKHHYCFF